MTQVKLEDLSSRVATLFDKYKEAQKRGLLSAAQKGRTWIVSKLIPSISPMPFDNGSFRAGWDVMPTETGAIIFNPVPHAPFINFGVPPDRVRVSGRMLEEWVARKGIAGGKDVPRVAWLIARKLRRTGIFMDPQFRITKRTVDEYLKDEVAKEVAAELRKVGWNR